MKSLFFFILLVFNTSAFAGNQLEFNGLKIHKPYAYKPLKGSTTTAGYLKFENTSDKNIKVTAIQAQGFKAMELHESKMKNGRMSMKKVNSLTVPANSSLELKPGGLHIMLIEQIKPNKKDKIHLTFAFEGKKQSIAFAWKDRNAKPKKENGHDHSHDHHHH